MKLVHSDQVWSDAAEVVPLVDVYQQLLHQVNGELFDRTVSSFWFAWERRAHGNSVMHYVRRAVTIRVNTRRLT